MNVKAFFHHPLFRLCLVLTPAAGQVDAHGQTELVVQTTYDFREMNSRGFTTLTPQQAHQVSMHMQTYSTQNAPQPPLDEIEWNWWTDELLDFPLVAILSPSFKKNVDIRSDHHLVLNHGQVAENRPVYLGTQSDSLGLNLGGLTLTETWSYDSQTHEFSTTTLRAQPLYEMADSPDALLKGGTCFCKDARGKKPRRNQQHSFVVISDMLLPSGPDHNLTNASRSWLFTVLTDLGQGQLTAVVYDPHIPPSTATTRTAEFMRVPIYDAEGRATGRRDTTIYSHVYGDEFGDRIPLGELETYLVDRHTIHTYDDWGEINGCAEMLTPIQLHSIAGVRVYERWTLERKRACIRKRIDSVVMMRSTYDDSGNLSGTIPVGFAIQFGHTHNPTF